MIFFNKKPFDVICSGSKKQPAVFAVVDRGGVFHRIWRHGHDLRRFRGFDENASRVTFLKAEYKGVPAIANSGLFEVWPMDVGDAGS